MAINVAVSLRDAVKIYLNKLKGGTKYPIIVLILCQTLHFPFKKPNFHK